MSKDDKVGKFLRKNKEQSKGADLTPMTLEGHDVLVLPKGPKGADGKDGKDGKDGAKGESIRGAKGDKGDSIIGPKGDKGDSVVGPQGIKGEDGDDGVGIQDIDINVTDELIVTLDNGAKINAGLLPTGKRGKDGKVVKIIGGYNQPASSTIVTDGDYGDITVSSSGTVWTIDDDTVTEAKLSFADTTTANSTTVAHGLMPKLSGSATTFFRSDGAQATPAGTVSSYIEQAFSAQTSVVVTHTFGAHPVVQVLNASDAVLIPLTITHNSVNAFTVTFTASTTGKILASVGSPQPASYVTVTNDYTVLGGDYYVECTAVDKTMTLPTAVGREGQAFSLDNSSAGYMYIELTGAETLQGETLVQISNGALVAVSNGTNYRIK